VTGGEMAGWATLAAALWAAGYLAACAWWPYAACRRCSGTGRKMSPSGKYWRPCRRCKGSATRVRLGRRLWDRLVRFKDSAVG
jgi:hypothetical protein